jgi:glycosyltransferase involved in cell wall biosynthesis
MTHRVTSLDVIIPCYNEADGLAESLRVIDSYVGPLAVSTRFILVDDGSSDATWSVIDNKVREDPSRFVGLKLSRNRGHQTALIAGLEFSDADAVVSMDADLQDDPAILPEMLELAQAGAAVVFGVRCDRSSDSWVKSATARA